MTSPKNGQLPQSDDSQVNEQQKQTRIGTHPQSPNGVFQYDLGLLPEVMIPPSNIEMGHIMGQTVLPYADSYYMAAYAAQPTIYPQVMGIHQAGLQSPNEAVEETVYVNAKQYHGILRRRQSRAKAESEKRAKSRKPYLHESRHLHALRRARGCGGRFLNAKTDQENQMEDTEEANSGGS